MSVVEVQSWWSIYFRSVTNSSSFYLLFSGSSYNQPFWISIAIKLGLKFISVPEGCVIIVLSYEVAGTKLILVIIMIAILSIICHHNPHFYAQLQVYSDPNESKDISF